MSDMETARRAGGAKWPFTAAVVTAVVIVVVLFVWQGLAGQI